MSMLAKNQAVNLPKPPKRPWHASQFGHHTELTCSAELSQQRLLGLSCYYWQCVRDISASSRKGRWLPSLVMQPVLLKTSPPPPTSHTNFHPTSSSPPPPSRWLHCVESCGYKNAPRVKPRPVEPILAQVCRIAVRWEAATRFFFSFSSFLLHFLNNRCDDSVLACTCATPRCACISTHLSGGSASDKITLGLRTAGALIVFQRATCLR